MLSKRRIAVLIAGLLVGAQVGVAAISEESNLPPSAEQEYLEPAPAQAEYVEPAPAQAEPVDQVAAPGPVEPREAPATQAEARGDAFPSSADEWKMLPAQIAYFDRLEASRRAAGIELVARGDAFPSSADEWKMLPAQIAYFDRVEATRLAASNETVTRSDVSLLRGAAEKLANLLRPRAQSADQEIPENVGLVENSSSSDSGN